MRKALIAIAIILVALPAFLFAVLGVLLHSGMAGELLRGTIDRSVDADVSYSAIKGSMMHLPELTLELDDLLVSYPHERFDSLCTNNSSFAREGRGEQADTLLYVRHFDAGINLLELLKGTVWISFAEAEELRAYLHLYGPQEANWNIFPPSDKEKKRRNSAIPSIMLRHVNFGGDSRVVFCSHKDVFSSAVDFEKFRVERDAQSMDMSLALNTYVQKGCKAVVSAPLAIETNFSAKNRFGTFVLFVSNLSADIFGIPLEAEGKIELRPHATAVDLSAVIPNCQLSSLLDRYASLLPDRAGKISTDTQLTISIGSEVSLSDGNLDLKLNEVCLRGNGVDMSASGIASDLLGEGLKFSVDMTSRIDLEPLLSFIFRTDKAFDAQGTLDFRLEANDVMRRHFRIPGFMDADVRAEIDGDVLDLRMPAQKLIAHIAHPHAVVRNMESLVQDGKRALAAYVSLDSAEARFNGQYIKGRKVVVMAQNTVGDIHDTTQVPPVSARINADMLALRGADSLSLAVLGTENHMVIKPVSVEDRNVPDVSLESKFDRVVYLSSSDRIGLWDVRLDAEARKRVPWNVAVKERHTRQAILHTEDSTYVPEFLKEKEFKSADINFSLAKSMQALLYEWNPSFHLGVDGGVVFMSAYPVNNRIKNLELSVTPSEMQINKVAVLSGSSDISLSATLKGLRKIMTGKGRGMLNLDADIDSRRLDLNEILTAVQASKTTGKSKTASQTIENVDQVQDAFSDTLSMTTLKDSASRGYPLIIVPANLNASISVRGDSVKYAGFNFNGISAGLNMKERCLLLSDLNASSDMGSVSMDAFYSTVSKDSINLGYNLSLSDITAGKVIELIPKVGETVPFLNSFKGIIDFELTATSKIDTNMNFILPTISGVAEVNGKDLLIEDLGSVRKIARILRFKEREVGHIDDMSIKAIIGDNQIEIFPFILGVDRYQLALMGSQAFPTDYEYHISVIKSPLPFKMGIKIYGDSYKSVKYHLEKPRYKSTVLPLYDGQVDRLQLNLISSIRNIFDRGVHAALEETRLDRQDIAWRREDASDDGDILSSEEFKRLDLEMIRSQAEEEDELLSREIDQILSSF